MSKLTDALARSRDAFVEMGNTPNMSMDRAKAIAKFFAANVGLARVLKDFTVEEARSTYADFFGAQSEASFDDVVAGSSSSSAPDEETWSDAAQERPRRRRKRRPRNDAQDEEDIYNVLGVR